MRLKERRCFDGSPTSFCVSTAQPRVLAVAKAVLSILTTALSVKLSRNARKLAIVMVSGLNAQEPSGS